VLSGWSRSGDTWVVPWALDLDHRDTTGAMVDTSVAALAAYPEQVFVDDAPLTQVGSTSKVTAGTFYVDGSANRLYIGVDPAAHVVRASTLTDALYVNRGNGSKILGLGFRRYATPVARMGAVKAYADDVLVENSVFADNALAGLSLNGTDIMVRSSSMIRNGQLGLQANTSNGLVLDGVRAQHNNTERFRQEQAAGGAKITRSRAVVVKGSVFSSNHGTGLWIDQSSKGVTITGCRFTSNARHGVNFEISANLIFAGNLSENNGNSGVQILESNSAKIYNNALLNNLRDVNILDGTRVASADPGDSALDHRYPDDTSVTWEIKDVQVRGNVITSDGGARYLVGYDDTRSVTADYNAYWRKAAGSAQYFGAWGDWPSAMLASDSLTEFRSKTGQEDHGTSSVGGSNPYLDDGGEPTSAAPYGPALPSDVAGVLGVASESRLRAGLPADTP
jgi:hypothetical protein